MSNTDIRLMGGIREIYLIFSFFVSKHSVYVPLCSNTDIWWLRSRAHADSVDEDTIDEFLDMVQSILGFLFLCWKYIYKYLF